MRSYAELEVAVLSPSGYSCCLPVPAGRFTYGAALAAAVPLCTPQPMLLLLTRTFSLLSPASMSYPGNMDVGSLALPIELGGAMHRGPCLAALPQVVAGGGRQHQLLVRFPASS